MTHRIPTLTALALLLVGASLLAAQEPAGARPGAPDIAGMLESWLREPPEGAQRAAGLDYLRDWLGRPLLRDQLALAAEDASEPALARATALLTLGREKPTDVTAFGVALDDPDPTVRAAAAAALKPVVADPALTADAERVLRRALRDSVPAVAGRALEALGDRDAAALREYLAGRPPAELAAIARQLLQLAESRGASLVPLDSSGTLARRVADVTVEYVPTQRWPDWSVSAGTLQLRRGSGKPVVLARDVEVVRAVLPAALSGDGRSIAYETGDGHIRVRDVRSGRERDIGAGVAPRLAPLAPGFLFARRTKVSLERDRDVLTYTLYYEAFTGDGEPRELGTVTATAHQTVNGNASGIRWARVVEGDGGFQLAGDGLVAPLPLPDLTASD